MPHVTIQRAMGQTSVRIESWEGRGSTGAAVWGASCVQARQSASVLLGLLRLQAAGPRPQHSPVHLVIGEVTCTNNSMIQEGPQSTGPGVKAQISSLPLTCWGTSGRPLLLKQPLSPDTSNERNEPCRNQRAPAQARHTRLRQCTCHLTRCRWE